MRPAFVFILQSVLVLAGGHAAAAQLPAQSPHSPAQPIDPPAADAASLPAAPSASAPTQNSLSQASSCNVKNAGATMAATGAMRALAVSGMGGVSPYAGSIAVSTMVCVPHLPIVNWYARFVTGPEVKPMTATEKGRLAVHNLIDPFNLITILGEAAISVGENSHSGYGPGMKGYGRYVGVSFTQDMTGEFFDTFLISSIARQDPHYHRMPYAGIPRRALHCLAQVVWTQGDNGRGMVNYADVAGFAVDGEISNLYVPGQNTTFGATAERYAVGLATAPIDNFVVEFLPDVARHIHIQIVVVQRIINQIARTGETGVAP